MAREDAVLVPKAQTALGGEGDDAEEGRQGVVQVDTNAWRTKTRLQRETYATATPGGLQRLAAVPWEQTLIGRALNNSKNKPSLLFRLLQLVLVAQTLTTLAFGPGRAMLDVKSERADARAGGPVRSALGSAAAAARVRSLRAAP